MPTDKVKLLAIISVLNVPGKPFQSHFALPASLVTQAVPFRSLTPVARSRSRNSLPLLPPGRCRVTVVKFLKCHLCDGAVDGSLDGAVARLEVSFGAVVELLVCDHVGGEVGGAEDGDLVVGRLANAEKSC